MHDGQIVGAVTVTRVLYVEWSRLGEIGDVYSFAAFARQHNEFFMSAWRHVWWVTAQTTCLTHPTLMVESH
jgi:hypothetical protein